MLVVSSISISIALGYPLWTDGMTFNGQLGRLTEMAGFTHNGTATSATPWAGVLNNMPNALQVSAVSGMNINIAAGYGVLGNGTSVNNGAYRVCNQTNVSITVPTSDPTNPRIDLIIMSVHDNGDATSYSAIELIQGTPAVSPVQPTPSAGVAYIPLAAILVPASSSTVTAGNITDLRVYTVSAGGIIPWAARANAVGGLPGRIGYDKNTGRFFHDDGTVTGGTTIKTAPWAPVRVLNNTGGNFYNTEYTLGSTSITVDGVTDINIEVNIYGFLTTAATTSFYLQYYIDSTAIARYYVGTLSPFGGNIAFGGSYTYATSSVTGDTPSAGTHTIKVGVDQNTPSGGNTITVHAPITVTVRPVSG